MKRIAALLLLVVLLALAALSLSFRPAVLPVADAGAIVVPQAHPPQGMTIAVMQAGRMLSKAGFAYRGGALGEERVFGMAGVLVRHPKGMLLIDTGFGRDVDRHFLTVPWLMRATSRYEKETPVAQQLLEAGITPAQLTAVVLTHAHWDHVSGLADLPSVPVWVTQAELDFIKSGDPASALARSLAGVQWTAYGFPDGPYLGFESSYDVFKDGSVVIVPAGGHTPGSVVVFVTPPGDKRYAFVGDLVWQREGYEIPAERPWLSRTLVDQDPATVRARIGLLHRLAGLVPGLVIVPAHDRRVLESLPSLTSPKESAP